MRTASVCPTCATYENALCVLYEGPDIPLLDISTGDDMNTVVEKIGDYLNSITTTTTTTTTSSTTTTTTTTLPV